jgi:hypothetical protein
MNEAMNILRGEDVLIPVNPRLPLLLSVAVSLSLGCGYYSHGDGRGGGRDNGGTAGNPSVFHGNPTVGAVCDVDAPTDQCVSAGLACMPVLADAGFVCQVPGEFYSCDANVGCASGLGCHYGICLESCSTTADCWDPLTLCAPYGNAGNQCLLNECEGANGFGLWQACGASMPDAGDGTCVPLDANAGPSGCQQGGSVSLDGACQLNRGDGGPGFCAVGLLCVVDAVGDNFGICLPACNGFGGQGPSCGAGTSCVPTTLPLQPAAASALEFYSLSGACARSCTPSDGGSAVDGGLADAGADGGVAGATDGGCPAPTSCMNGSLGSTADYVCLP